MPDGEVVGRLTDLAMTCPDSFLPSIPLLSKELGVGTKRVGLALARLRSLGLVEFRRGTRVRLIRTATDYSPAPAISGHTPADEILYAEIRLRVIDGSLRTGEPLPQLKYQTRHLHVGSRTVRRAYDRLVTGGLVWRRGRQWIVGTPPPGSGRRDSGLLPVIVVVQPKDSYWQGLISERTMRFVERFVGEAESRQIQLKPCSLMEVAERHSYPVKGLTGLSSMIHELGERHVGTIVVGADEEVPAIEEVLDRLLAFKRPAVWFNRRTPVVLAERFRGRVPQACFSEEAAARAAGEFLVMMGHRTAGFLETTRMDWQDRRRDLLTAWGQASATSLRLVPSRAAMASLTSSGSDLEGALSRLHAEGHPNARQVIRCLSSGAARSTGDQVTPFAVAARRLRILADPKSEDERFGTVEDREILTPVWAMANIVPLLLNPEVTALLIPHDRSAARIHATLARMGVRVPEQISLLSFDNYLQHSLEAATTVSMGADDLGYRTFHYLLGTIPVRVDADGLMVGRCQVIRRGSVRRV